MIILSVQKTTGKQAYKIVSKAVKERATATGKPQSKAKQEFSEVSALSRISLHHYRNGAKPGHEGIMKIAAGLQAWGQEVRIEA